MATKPELVEETARHYQLANDLFARGELDAARKQYEAAIVLVPNFAEALHNLGDLLFAQGDIPGAVEHYERALSVKPDLAKTRYSLSTAQLICGDFSSGWKNYDARWANKNLSHPASIDIAPLWDGSPVNGNLLLWGEQGIGDEIMFAGFIPEILSRGQQVILKCANNRLLPIFRRSFPNIEVIYDITHQQFAAHLPLGDLPRILHPNLRDYRAPQGYLKTDPVITAAQDRKRFGISWHSKSAATGRQRSVKLSQLAPLFDVAGIEWINLQYGDMTELKSEAADTPIIFDPNIDPVNDMDSFAAQVASLDSVVTIDNASAHLAGALGVPSYVLLPYTPDWRWFLDRNDSPWYPTMRLFRQQQPGDWDSAIRALRQAMVSNA